MCALLLAPILEGVIGIKPRGDTREKQRTIRSLGWAFRTPIRTGKAYPSLSEHGQQVGS